MVVVVLMRLYRYCQCFAAKTFCNPTCNCEACANTADNMELRLDAMKNILERNPNAFDSKFKGVSAVKHLISNILFQIVYI
jgi:hypothetical protein